MGTGLLNREGNRLAILSHVYGVVNNYLRELGVDYWLDCGTLLGWYREKAILSHDADIDFGVLEADYGTLWSSRNRLPRGFTMYDTSRYHRGPKLYVSFRGYDADLYFYRTRGREAHWLTQEDNPRYMLDRPLLWFLPTQAAEFLGEATRVPNQPENYLQDLYGYLGENARFNKATNLWEPRT